MAWRTAVGHGVQGVEDGRLLGTNLAGVQLFSAEGGNVLQVAAEALGAEPQSRWP